MSKRIFLIIAIIGCFCHAVAAQVKFSASAPDVVVVGDQFRLSYRVNTDRIDDIKLPDLKGFEILMGPSQSSQSSSSYSIVNGKTTHTSSVSVTYTYILNPVKAGIYTIPAAVALVDGKKYHSNSLKIKVLPPDKNSSASSSSSASERMHTQKTGSQITGKDLFITVTASKKRVYEQEAVLLTYKVYTLVNLTQLAGNMPDLDGFHTQEIELPQQKNLTMEHHNGRNYGTVVWRQYLLFPQRSGKLTVPPIKFEALVVQQNRDVDPIEAFFNGTDLTSEVKKTIVAPGITLQVDPLPQRPANFSGAVGHFEISSSLEPNQGFKTNDALTLKLTVTGAGNMKLMNAPEVKFPVDFETYKPKVNESVKAEQRGAVGTKTFDYLAVPRHVGEYQIPSVEFCYFDPDAGTYKTLKTEPYKISVAKGSSRSSNNSDYTNKEDLKLLNSDIRYVKHGDPDFQNTSDLYFSSWKYGLSYALPFIVFLLFVYVFRKKAKEMANIAGMKGKRANSVAVKRLKVAKKLMEEQQSGPFFDETLKALWGYVSDKLTIPVAELDKDNMRQKLIAHGVSEEMADRFIDLLHECEFARFAPGDPNEMMGCVYQKAVQLIGELDAVIKK